jgi:chondroitin sulfate synthase
VVGVDVQMIVIELKGVDDAYPPQKKSLAMVFAMWSLFGDHYRWFVRLDDDAYLRHSALSQLLRPLNSSKAYVLGELSFQFTLGL